MRDIAPPEVAERRLKLLRSYLANLPPKQFDMTVWAYRPGDRPQECGTVACIGGWAELLFQIPEGRGDYGKVGAFIGLTRLESEHLFMMGYCHAAFHEVGHADAIAHLDFMIAGNRPDWDFVLDQRKGTPNGLRR